MESFTERRFHSSSGPYISTVGSAGREPALSLAPRIIIIIIIIIIMMMMMMMMIKIVNKIKIKTISSCPRPPSSRPPSSRAALRRHRGRHLHVLLGREDELVVDHVVGREAAAVVNICTIFIINSCTIIFDMPRARGKPRGRARSCRGYKIFIINTIISKTTGA